MSIGQSQTRVEILQQPSGGIAVRKSVEKESKRFRLQWEKHQMAAPRMLPLSVPIPIGTLHTTYYDMEYVRAIPLGSYLESAAPSEVGHVTTAITTYLETAVNSAVVDTGEGRDAFLKKIVSLEQSQDGQPRAGLVAQLIIHLKAFAEDHEFLIGWNHGDFSYENILVSGDGLRVYAIDFLDSPVDTPLLDWGRLWLDVAYGWWGAGLWPTANWQLNSMALRRATISSASSLGISQADLDAFAALSIARIIPYTRDPVRMAYLELAARRILGKAQL